MKDGNVVDLNSRRRILHYKNYALPDHGPHIRKCTECGVRLWLATDGEWTEDAATWRSPPPGYTRCIDAREEDKATVHS